MLPVGLGIRTVERCQRVTLTRIDRQIAIAGKRPLHAGSDGWVKIKNRQYSQAIGREDFFDRRKVPE
jgi:hypothetical protein